MKSCLKYDIKINNPFFITNTTGNKKTIKILKSFSVLKNHMF